MLGVDGQISHSAKVAQTLKFFRCASILKFKYSLSQRVFKTLAALLRDGGHRKQHLHATGGYKCNFFKNAVA